MTRKTVLTKGIEAHFGNVKAISDTGYIETSEPTDLGRIGEQQNQKQMARDIRTGRLTKGEIVSIFKAEGAEDPEGTAEAVIRAVLRGDANSNNFTSLFTPGQRPGILSAGGRKRTQGYSTGRNYSGRVDDERATVTGGSVSDGKETGDYGRARTFNPTSLGQGYPEAAGRERYGDNSVAGGGSDKQPTAAQYRRPTTSVQGETNPNFVVSSTPGRSGIYGGDTRITSRKSLQIYPTRLQKTLQEEDEDRENFAARVSGQPRQEELDRLMEEDTTGPIFSEEEIRTAIAQAEREELRAKRENDEITALARKQLKEDLKNQLFKQKIAKSYGR